MRILWRVQAESDLEAIFDYLIENRPKAALRIYQTIHQKVDQLATMPGLGRPGRVGDTRELIITRTPYIVVYTVDTPDQMVIVLRVLHGARAWPESFADA